MNFAISLALRQMSEGRSLILKRPQNARSWKLPKMLDLLGHPDVFNIIAINQSPSRFVQKFTANLIEKSFG